MDGFETLAKCDKIPAESRAQIKAGYLSMLRAMVDLGDKGEMIEGCGVALESLKSTLTTAGC